MILKNGSKGTNVEKLQKLLNLHGANPQLVEDGDFGSKTHEAVMAFQSSHQDKLGADLVVDGNVGPDTWWALRQVEQDIERVNIPEDIHTLNRLKNLHPSVRDEALTIYREIRERGVSIRVTSTFRSFNEQDKLFAQGRTKPGKKVTNARAGQSYHNYGLAIDFCLLLNNGKKASWNRKLDLDNDGMADWEEVVFVFKNAGWEWGGTWQNFPDYPHFEKRFGFHHTELKKRVENGEVDVDGFVKI